MRIAISADSSNGLDSVVSPHFGRCPYFVLVDMEEQDVTAISAVSNPYYGNHRPGQVPAFIDNQGVNVMLTGKTSDYRQNDEEQRSIDHSEGHAIRVYRTAAELANMPRQARAKTL